MQTAEDWESSMGSDKTWLLDQPEPAAQHAERAGKMYLCILCNLMRNTAQ